MINESVGTIASAYRRNSGLHVPGRPDNFITGDVVSARGATVKTANGGDFVDFASGGFGYGHPYVIEQVSAQIRRMPLSSRMFFSRPLATLATRIASLTPGALEVSFFGASGSEAMEGALKLARGVHPKHRRVVVARGAFHGGTMGALSACGIDALRNPLGELPLRAVVVPYGDAAALSSAVDDETLAIVLEPVLTSSGVLVPPPGYFALARARATATGALFIVDEVTTGMGQTGHLFATSAHGVTPDILVLGGALGGGVLPIGAYVTTRELNGRVYDKVDPLLHANTTGGNPSACVAALAGLEVIEREGLATRALESGARIREVFGELARAHSSSIARVESCGLFAAMRLRDAATLHALQRRAFERGVLTRATGLLQGEAWLAFRPPLTHNSSELERGLDALTRAMAEVLSAGPFGIEAAQ